MTSPLVDPLTVCLALPPGSCVHARVSTGSAFQADFLIHEETARIDRLPKHPEVRIRSGMIEQSGVQLVAVMLLVDRNFDLLYETWWNYHADDAAYSHVFLDMATQERMNLHFHDRPGLPRRSVQICNALREAFQAYCLCLADTPPWSMAQFNDAREEIYRKYPTPEALWKALK